MGYRTDMSVSLWLKRYTRGVALQLSRYTCVASVALCFRSVALLSRYTLKGSKKGHCSSRFCSFFLGGGGG